MSPIDTSSDPESPGWPGQRVHLLSNGRYSTLLTASGGGFSALDGFALTRWAPDTVRDAGAFVLYFRDPDTGARWSAGSQPLGGGTSYRASFEPGSARLERRVADIETTTSIAVAADLDAEVRHCRLINRGTTTRRIEVTSYAELALDTPPADAAHPAFSKLFVQTGYLPDHESLIAWRRLREPGDRPLWAVHRLLVNPAGAAGAAAPELETDRMRFLGRGRGPADPHALDGDVPLAGTAGSVLDPVFSLRRVVELAPGAQVAVVAVLGAGASREAVVSFLRRVATVDDGELLLSTGPAPPAGAADSLGLPAAWTAGLRIETRRRWSAGAAAEPVDGAGAAAAPAPSRASEPAAPGPAAGAGAGDVPGPRPGTAPAAERLRLPNGYGGFSEDGTEYVIRIEPDGSGRPRLPPLPWVNVIANEEAGFVVSERGAVCTWSENSRENRLTPWSNDPVSDPHGEALYVRDEADGRFWSPTPGPAPAAAGYEVRHGFGYTRVRHSSHGLDQEVCFFLPRRDPVRIARVRITNRSGRTRSLSVFSYSELVLGALRCETRGSVLTEHSGTAGAVIARNPDRGEYSGRVAFAAAVSDLAGAAEATTDRAAFLGAGGDVVSPAAVRSGDPLDGRVGAGLDACAAFRVRIELAPGEAADCAFLLGEAKDEEFARASLLRHCDIASIDRGRAAAVAFWRELVGGVAIETPAPALDLMVNGWLAYQNLSCRIFGRSALYQSGGAFGFRDQLQDAAALLYLQPAFTRRQIVLHAEHQFVEGDVMHWWHPPLGKGMRTRFSDDLLWLPYVAAFYVQRTGDESVFDEPARFLTAPRLEPGEDEAFLVPQDSGERASVYEHCCRALDHSLTRGPHGLPLMGAGDWNDGMNRVGRDGRGESVWLGFFLYAILDDFIPLCERRGDGERAERYREYRRELADALNGPGWDGAWYLRAFYDDGTPLGSAGSDECRIDTIAQAWAVISGAAPPERAELALDAMETHLVSEPERLIRLLAPAFDRTPHDPGYIKAYIPGVRENGGQYTHGALWAVRALAEAGRGDRAARLLEMLSPVSHTSTPGAAAVYRAEPYVIAADVYGVEPHVGRGGWTWYTGSAGWMYRVALESVLGLELLGGRALALRPCIPDEWPGFRLRYRLPDGVTVYRIDVERAAPGASLTQATADGEAVAVDDGAVVVPLRRDGLEHHVHVLLASDVGPWYAPRLPRAAAVG